MIDTLKISNSLQSHQFSREQAEAMAEAIGEIAVGEIVTRKDLDLAKSDLQLAIERLRGELQRSLSCFPSLDAWQRAQVCRNRILRS
jgi:hypothetical protein